MEKEKDGAPVPNKRNITKLLRLALLSQKWSVSGVKLRYSPFFNAVQFDFFKPFGRKRTMYRLKKR